MESLSYRVCLENGKRHFDQWDRGQRLIAHGIPADVNVDFILQKKESYMRKTYTDDGVVYVNVPDIVLQSSGVLKCYFYLNRTALRGETVYKWSVCVDERPKPSDYVYTEEELRDYRVLEARIKVLEDNSALIFGPEYEGQMLYVSGGKIVTLKLGPGLEIREGILCIIGSAPDDSYVDITTHLDDVGVLHVYKDGAEIYATIDDFGVANWPGVPLGVDESGTLFFKEE